MPSGNIIVKERLEAVQYGVGKCLIFLAAQTPEEALAALQHVSQLAPVVPNEILDQIIRRAVADDDFRLRYEICYLMQLWGKADEKMKLLSPLKHDSEATVRDAFKELQALKNAGPTKVEIVESTEELWADFPKLRDTITGLRTTLIKLQRIVRQQTFEERMMALMKASGRNLAIPIGSMLAAVALIGLLCFLAVSDKISWLMRFSISFVVVVLSYEVFLVGREFWKNWKERECAENHSKD